MSGHEKRAHALLSASSAHRWLYCTPSARLEEQFPDTVSVAAKEGTLAHELAEARLKNYFFSVDFGKRKLTGFIKKLKGEELWQEEMLGHTETYLDYVKRIALGFQSAPYVAIEKQVDYGTYAKGGFGTADCVLVSGSTLYVIDFKYGKGVPVSAEGNPQLSLYALGAYEAYKILYPITEVQLAIVQPRLDSISEWGCTVEELLEFGEFVKRQADLAWKGEGNFQPGEKTCRFCRARAVCRARAEENVKLAFAVGKKPPLVTDSEVGEYLRQGEDVDAWLKDLKEYALGQCLAGKEIPGWKAVEGRGSRDWTDMEEAFRVLQEKEVPKALLYEEKPLTLAQVEKAIGKKEFNELVGKYVKKNPGKPALAPESDKRPAITNKITAEEAFKEEKDHE